MTSNDEDRGFEHSSERGNHPYGECLIVIWMQISSRYYGTYPTFNVLFTTPEAVFKEDV